MLLGVSVLRETVTHVSIGEHRTLANRRASKHNTVITTQARRTTRKGNSRATYPFNTNFYIPLGILSSLERDKPYRLVTSVFDFCGTPTNPIPYSSADERTETISHFPKRTVIRFHLTIEDAGKRRKTMPKGGTADVMPTIRNRTRQRTGVHGLVISVSFLSRRNGQA